MQRFRWAYCQLHQLKALPLMRPKDVKRTLNSLPESLDETYERMLNNIDHISQEEVRTLLKWLAYAQRPLSLREITETITIELNREDSIVDTLNRLHPKGIENLLARLITIKQENKEKYTYDDEDTNDDEDNDVDEE